MFFVGKIIYVHLKRRLISAYLKVSLFYPMYWCWDSFLLPQFVRHKMLRCGWTVAVFFATSQWRMWTYMFFQYTTDDHLWHHGLGWAYYYLQLLQCVYLLSLSVIILVIFCFALWNCRTGMITEAVTLQENPVILWLGKQVEQSWAILSLDYTFCVCMSTKAPSDVNFISRWWAQGSVCTSACLSVNCDFPRRVVITVLQIYMLMCGWSIAALRVHVCNRV